MSLALVALLAGAGCDDDKDDTGGSSETDTDTDSDTDSDTDGDTDSDTDGDTDSDTDGDTDSDTDVDLATVWGFTLLYATTPTADVTVDAYEGGSPAGDTISDAAGLYSLDLAPGDYTLYGGYDSDGDGFDEFYGSTGTVTLAAGDEVQVDIDLWDDVTDAPYIYLYPERPTKVQVDLLIPDGVYLKRSEPRYQDGWRVLAEPDGTLSQRWDFLFYESSVEGPYDDARGWSVPAPEVFDFFRDALPELGLSEPEVEDFVDFWQWELPWAPCYEIYPQGSDLIEDNMGLRIEPEPDSLLRMWLMVRGAGSCAPLRPPAVEPFERVGFTAVEWGVILDSQAFPRR